MAKGRRCPSRVATSLIPGTCSTQHGADAFRWYLYTASPPGQERRFSVDLVGEVVRNFTLTLWNVYSFFVTYANLDDWSPALCRIQERALTQRPGPLAALGAAHVLVREVTQALETYDVTGATRPIQAFVDNLSKWYLRRSPPPFLEERIGLRIRQAAYATLYEALVTLSKLLAPTMPFLAEEMYQNLVRSAGSSCARIGTPGRLA